MHTCVYIYIYVYIYTCLFTYVYASKTMHHVSSCIIKLYHIILIAMSQVSATFHAISTLIRFWANSESSNNLRNKSAVYQCLLSVHIQAHIHPAGLRVLPWWRNQVQPLHALVLEGRSLSQHHKQLCCLHNGNNNRKTFTHELQHSICESFNFEWLWGLCFSSADFFFRLAFVATPGGPVGTQTR